LPDEDLDDIIVDDDGNVFDPYEIADAVEEELHATEDIDDVEDEEDNED
jgi:hypothetical protein